MEQLFTSDCTPCTAFLYILEGSGTILPRTSVSPQKRSRHAGEKSYYRYASSISITSPALWQKKSTMNPSISC